MSVLTHTHPELEEGIGSAGHCPACHSLWSNSALLPKKAPRERVFPEGGWFPIMRASIREVFEMMLGSETGPGVDYPPNHDANLTAMIGIAGQLMGTMAVRCTTAAACGMAGAMLGIEVTEPNEDVRDALGEVCNMVAGNFKHKISGLAEGCSLSCPTVISGGDYQVHPLAQGERVVVSFTFQGEPVWVSLDLHE
jgi:chemotaxis protein CheX